MSPSRTDPSSSPQPPVLAHTLTAVIAVLVAVAGAGGLWLPGLYRESPEIVAVMRSQDLVTLLALPVLVGALRAVRAGSLRGRLVWLGILGYLLYTYIGAAFAYTFNEFFLIYVTIFSLCMVVLVAALVATDAAALREKLRAGAPRRGVSLFLLFMAFILGVGELGQVIGFLGTGTPPELIPGTDATPNFVLALDLGVVVPLAAVAGLWLWRDVAWGYVLAGLMLVTSIIMGLALLSMTWFGMRAGLPVDPALTLLWIAIAGGGIVLAARFLRTSLESGSSRR